MIEVVRYRPGGPEPGEAATLTPGDGDPGGPSVDGTLTVVTLTDPGAAEIDRVVRWLGVHPLAAEDLHQANQRTKLEAYTDQWHVALHAIRVGRSLETVEVDLVVGAGWLLLVGQDGTGDVLAEARRRFERVRTGAGDDRELALWALLDTLVDGYFRASDWVEDRLDDLEEVVFGARRGDDVPQESFELRRALVRFRRVTAPVREVLNQVLRGDLGPLPPSPALLLRDVYDHALRIAELLEAQRELLTGLLEAHLAIVSNRMNEVMKRVSSWGALILVPTLIAGWYGMNFEGMFLQDARYGYATVLGFSALVTYALYRLLRARRWL